MRTGLATFAVLLAGVLSILAAWVIGQVTVPRDTREPEGRAIAGPERPAGPLARAGEWVTTPEGDRVCRLAYDLSWGTVLRSNFCTDWQAPWHQLPEMYALTAKDVWARNQEDGKGGVQFHVENRWVP